MTRRANGLKAMTFETKKRDLDLNNKMNGWENGTTTATLPANEARTAVKAAAADLLADELDDEADTEFDDFDALDLADESEAFSDLDLFDDDLDELEDEPDEDEAGFGLRGLEAMRQSRRDSALSHVDTGDFLSRYMLETNRQELLTAEEEVQLAKEIEAGKEAAARLENEDSLSLDEREALALLVEQGEGARAFLVRSNTRLVISIAKRYYGQGLDFLDLIQEGNIGLLTAVDKFDYRRGNALAPMPPGGSARALRAPWPITGA